MNDHNERIDQLERAQAAQATELAALREQVSHEKAEREALQRITLPPLAEMQKDLQINIDYFCTRLDELKARATGGSSALSTDAALAAFAEVFDALQLQGSNHLHSFAATVLNGLRVVFEADRAKDLKDAAVAQALDERVLAIERCLAPALEGRVKIVSIAA